MAQSVRYTRMITRNWRRVDVKRRLLSVLLLVGTLYVSACASIGEREIEASEEYLTPAGWRNVSALLEAASFPRYVEAVTAEVGRYRIPFDSAQAGRELSRVIPQEVLPAPACAGREHGIAILVHGLSDTAFSMRELGEVLSRACYRSRIILLPGHGTRAGDLLKTRLHHWQSTLDYLVEQAAQESETVILAGFSLGAVLTLESALKHPERVDGVVGISPAYYLSSARLARWAPWAAPFVPWVDRGVADDPMRYEAMPTRGVAETWKAIKSLHRALDRTSVTMPWMLIQSMDDLVVVPEQNESLWRQRAIHPKSRLLRLVSDQSFPQEPGVVNLPARSDEYRVLGLTHLAVHQSPDNPHYGVDGSYRNCGGGAPRDVAQVSLCETADAVSYGLWNTEPVEGQALAFSTFNPSFNAMSDALVGFALDVATASREP